LLLIQYHGEDDARTVAGGQFFCRRLRRHVVPLFETSGGERAETGGGQTP